MLIPKRLLLVTGITLTQFACSREPLPEPAPQMPSTATFVLSADAPTPPMSGTRKTTIVEEGGIEEVRDTATGTGGRMTGSGDAAKLDNGVFTVPAATLEAIGNAIGGGVSGSLTAKVGGEWIIRILALLVSLGLGALAFLNFKKTPWDWHYWGGLGLGALAAFVVFIQPEFLYVGIAGVAIAGIVNFWPSIAAAKFRSAGDEMQEFIDDDPDRAKAWEEWIKLYGENKDKAAFTIFRKDSL